tara:strand:+ start:306 stop:1199 length:894 start_codon:yes stop_codon:yes gene_type:complete
MKILVLGSQGQLGRCLYDQFVGAKHEVIFTSRKQVDVTEFVVTRNYILDQEPDVIINATAYTAVDKAENDKQVAEIVNNLAVKNIAEICKKIDCWLVHISTDYVFDGTSDLFYVEDDKTNPQSVYGETKLRGELAIQSTACKYIIIRTAWVFSEYGNNFLTKMLSLASKQEELSVVGDQIGQPTYCQEIAKAIICIIDNLKDTKIQSDLYHLSGNLSCSWAEFAKNIFDVAFYLNIIDSKPNVVSIATEQFSTVAKRPAQSQMNSSKIKNVFGICSPDCLTGIHSSLEAVKDKAFKN